eukprot:5089243-Lingulodinium_polyedra.AAC.1
MAIRGPLFKTTWILQAILVMRPCLCSLASMTARVLFLCGAWLLRCMAARCIAVAAHGCGAWLLRCMAA